MRLTSSIWWEEVAQKLYGTLFCPDKYLTHRIQQPIPKLRILNFQKNQPIRLFWQIIKQIDLKYICCVTVRFFWNFLLLRIFCWCLDVENSKESNWIEQNNLFVTRVTFKAVKNNLLIILRGKYKSKSHDSDWP